MLTIALFALASNPTGFPSNPGSIWTYDLTVLRKRGTMEQRVASYDDGRISLSMHGQIGKGSVNSSEVWLLQGGMIARASSGQGEYRPPLPVFKGGAGSWNWRGTLGGRPAAADVSVSPGEAVTTPAGSYQANRIEVNLIVDDNSIRTTYWFAKTVGWVKIESDLPGGVVTLSLRSVRLR